MPAKTRTIAGLDSQAIKALGHPLRLDALRIFNERAQASPSEIAQSWGSASARWPTTYES